LLLLLLLLALELQLLSYVKARVFVLA